MKSRDIWALARDAGFKFWADDGPRLGAALAYYFSLALSPLLLVVVALAGLFFGTEAARGEVVERFRDAVGADAAAVVERLAVRPGSTAGGATAAAVTAAVLVFGATGVFVEIRGALNAIWMVPGRRPDGGLLAPLRSWLLGFSLVCATALLLLASLVVTAVFAGLDERLSALFFGYSLAAQVVNFVLTAVLFAMIFRWLPETRITWRDVWIGAAVTAALFSAGRHAIGLYLGQTAIRSTYGAAGAFVGLLVWVYYSSQIFLFGAEFTFLFAQRFGSGVRTPTGTMIGARGPARP